MEQVELRVHNHPLLRFARFYDGRCAGCSREGYFYGGYRCNELGCDKVFHKECAESKPEISHHAHPEHPLKLFMKTPGYKSCPVCKKYVWLGYSCSICDFSLHLVCARISSIENHKVHEHPLEPSKVSGLSGYVDCRECKFVISLDGKKTLLRISSVQSIHSLDFPRSPSCSRCKPQIPSLKNLKLGAPSYADNRCLLCGIKYQDELFNREMNNLHQHQKVELYHCDVCNVSICMSCEGNPPPLVVVSPTTHEHQLHLIPRILDFTCNACGIKGDRSPYFCLQCNFMIYRQCIDLPRIININRHDHRVSYTWHLGHGNRNCGVCRKTVDGFYGAYSCSKCSNYVVHSLCATRKDVWDMVELEGTLRRRRNSTI